MNYCRNEMENRGLALFVPVPKNLALCIPGPAGGADKP